MIKRLSDARLADMKDEHSQNMRAGPMGRYELHRDSWEAIEELQKYRAAVKASRRFQERQDAMDALEAQRDG